MYIFAYRLFRKAFTELVRAVQVEDILMPSNQLWLDLYALRAPGLGVLNSYQVRCYIVEVSTWSS